MKTKWIRIAVLLGAVLALLTGTALAAEMDYTIDSFFMYTVEDGDYYYSPTIPVGQFRAEAEVVDRYRAGQQTVLLVRYGFDGRMLGIDWLEEPSDVYGNTAYFGKMIDNSDGSIGCIKAFVVPTEGPMVPLAEGAVFEEKLPGGTIHGITVTEDPEWEGEYTIFADVTIEGDCTLRLTVTNDENNRVVVRENQDVRADDTEVAFAVGGLPRYFVITAQLYDEEGDPVSEPYTCFSYSNRFAQFEEKQESDYDAERLIDVAEANDGNFIVLADDVVRLYQRPISEGEGAYTFAAVTQLQELAAGDKISFRNSDGVYITIRIASVSADGGTVIITEDSTAKIADLYAVIKIDADIVAQPSESTGAAVYRYAGAMSRAVEENDAGVFSSIEMGPSISSNVHTSFGSLDAELRAGGHVAAYYDPAVWSEDYLKIEVLTKIAMEGDLTVGPTVYAKEELLLFPEIPLAGLEIIGHIPLKLTGGFEIECQAGMNMHISAEVGAGYTFDNQTGVQKHSYKSITPSDVTTSNDAQGSMKIEVGVRFSVGVELLNDLISTSIGVGAGVGVEGEVEVATTPIKDSPDYHACDVCVNGRSYAYAEADVNIHYHVSEKIEGDLLDLNLLRAEWDIGKLYISLLNDARSVHKGQTVFGWGECPNKKYLVTFQTYNNGQLKTGQSVTVLDSDGRTAASGSSTFKVYLYPDSYTAEATIETNDASTDFVVIEARTVPLYAVDAVLQGVVTDGETQEVLSGVTVMILKDREIFHTAMTGADGSYSIQLPGGAYNASFVMEGYESAVYTLKNLQKDTTLNAALEPIVNPGILSGTVTDAETGEPISMAKIRVVDAEGHIAATAGVNGQGMYTLELKAGSYTVTFSAENYESRTAEVTIEPLETATRNASLTRTLFILSGIITEAESDPLEVVSGAVVTASIDGEVKGNAVTDGSGRYSMALSIGEYKLHVSAEGYESASGTANVTSRGGSFSAALKKPLGTGQCGPNLYWTLSQGGTLRIYGEGEMYDYNTKGDGKAEFYPPWGDKRTSILRLVVEEGATTIGDNAFGMYYYSSFYKLSSISLPSTLQSIGDGAFRDCGTGAYNHKETLTSITIPENVETIGNSAFSQCDALVRVSLPNGLKSIGSQAFRECGLREIYIPDSVTELGTGAFYFCTDLVQVHLPAGLTKLKEEVLVGCKALTEVNIPDGVTTIGKAAFNRCESLTSLVLPDTVTTIEDTAFSSCYSLQSVTLSKNLQGKIGDQAFWYCTSLRSIVIPEGVTYLGARCFRDCPALKSITLPVSLEGFNRIEIFKDCGLTDLYYMGTAQQWEQIKPREGSDTAEALKNVTIHCIG